MNHSQQLEQSLGKRTELIYTSSILNNIYNNAVNNMFNFVYNI